MDSVLVTGGTGFLGFNLVNLLSKDKSIRNLWVPDSKALNITNEQSVKEYIEYSRPDTIFHLAANPLVSDPKVLDTNLLGTFNLLKHSPGCNFIFASSATVYGDLGKEKMCRETDPTIPTSVYGLSKLMSEILIEEFVNADRTRSAFILRLVANVGAGSTHGIVHDFIQKLLSDEPYLEVLGDQPGSSKPFLFVKDTAKAFVAAAKTCEQQRYPITANVSSWDSISVEEVAYAVMEVCNIHKPIKWLGESANFKGDNKVVRISNERFHIFADWEPECKTALEAVKKGTQHALEYLGY